MNAPPDFFISRTGKDSAIANEVRDILVKAGKSVVLQDFDFKNRNFMQMMDASLASGARIIALLSQDYLNSDRCAAEWYHPLCDDPLNKRARLIVFRVSECAPQGLLKGIAYWDLTSLRQNHQMLANIVLAAVDKEQSAKASLPLSDLWKTPGAVIDSTNIRPTPGFTGRSDEIAAIGAALSKRRRTTNTTVVSLHGFAGLGKSTLARQYAWEVSNSDTYSGVWWLNAEKAALNGNWPGIEDGLIRLGSVFIRQLADATDREAAARHTIKFLDQAGFRLPWLFIFDNVDDSKLLDAWQMPRGSHAILTSRLAKWDPGELIPLRVGTWPRDDAVHFLRSQSQREEMTFEEAGQITERLGDLPLALTHAAAYLADNDAANSSDYLAAIDRHIDTVPQGASRIAPRAVFATFAENIAQASGRLLGVGEILSFASFFGPDDIPLDLFEQSPELYPGNVGDIVSDRSLLIEALGALGQLSLLDYSRRRRSFSVHRLMQAVSQHLVGSDWKAWHQSAVKVASSAFPKGGPATANVSFGSMRWSNKDSRITSESIGISLMEMLTGPSAAPRKRRFMERIPPRRVRWNARPAADGPAHRTMREGCRGEADRRRTDRQGGSVSDAA